MDAKKKVWKPFNKKWYYLGVLNGEKIYLEEGSWECGWYWGLGYVESYDSKIRDISMHTHFDSLFFSGPSNGWDNFKSKVTDCPLTDHELWNLMELMKTLYTLREAAEVFHRGGSHYVTHKKEGRIVKQTVYAKKINEKLIPELLSMVYDIIKEEE